MVTLLLSFNNSNPMSEKASLGMFLSCIAYLILKVGVDVFNFYAQNKAEHNISMVPRQRNKELLCKLFLSMR